MSIREKNSAIYSKQSIKKSQQFIDFFESMRIINRTDRFDKKLLQYIQNNEGNGMQFMAEYYN